MNYLESGKRNAEVLKLAVKHLMHHERTGRQSKELKEGWTEVHECFHPQIQRDATGEVCIHEHRRWVLDNRVLVCLTCGADCT